MNYYQQGNSIVNISPYQQNIDIIKNFFKKPIVLVNTIIETLAIPVVFLMLYFLSNFMNSLIYESYSSSYSYYDYYSYNPVPMFDSFLFGIGIIACIPAVLTIVAKFLIYFKSKNPDPNVKPSAGFTILWVMSIISVVFLSLACFIFVISMIIAIFAVSAYSAYENYSYGYGYGSTQSSTMLLVVIFIIYLVVFAVAFFFIINQMRFYGSVRKGLNSIYLKNNGAMIYGVFQIVGGVFSTLTFLMYVFVLIAFASVAAMDSSMANVPLDFFAAATICIGLSAASAITGGIIAVKYSGYIKNIVLGSNQQFNANVPYSNPVPVAAPSVNPFDNAYPQQQPQPPMQNNPYGDVQNENPYTAPQQVTPPQPTEPVAPENEYYQPVENPAPQEEAPQPESPKTETPQAEDVHQNNFCPNCGSKVFRSDIFCNNCGTKLR